MEYLIKTTIESIESLHCINDILKKGQENNSLIGTERSDFNVIETLVRYLKSQGCNHFIKVPDDLIIHLCMSELSFDDIKRLRITCKRFNDLLTSGKPEGMFKQIALNRWTEIRDFLGRLSGWEYQKNGIPSCEKIIKSILRPEYQIKNWNGICTLLFKCSIALGDFKKLRFGSKCRHKSDIFYGFGIEATSTRIAIGIFADGLIKQGEIFYCNGSIASGKFVCTSAVVFDEKYELEGEGIYEFVYYQWDDPYGLIIRYIGLFDFGILKDGSISSPFWTITGSFRAGKRGQGRLSYNLRVHGDCKIRIFEDNIDIVVCLETYQMIDDIVCSIPASSLRQYNEGKCTKYHKDSYKILPTIMFGFEYHEYCYYCAKNCDHESIPDVQKYITLQVFRSCTCPCRKPQYSLLK